MYCFRTKDNSGADNSLVATPTNQDNDSQYHFKRLHYPDIYISNRGAAWSLFFKDEESAEKKKLKADVEHYNEYLDYLDEVTGFRSYFVSHNFCISKDEVVEHWSDAVAEMVFSEGRYIFDTDLKILGSYLVDTSVPKSYVVKIGSDTVQLPLGKSSDYYPDNINERKLIWNWVENGHDFCFALWELLGEPYCSDGDNEDEPTGVVYSFDAYDQFRHEDPEPQLIMIFRKLESLGYISTYTIYPEPEDALWKYYGKPNGSIDVAIVDQSFLKNRLVMEQIDLLLWVTPEELFAKPFFVTDRNGKQLFSAKPGSLGGHRKLKIYGKLDCPSALRHLKKGNYAKNRVFFLDEESAVQAGYRPCSVCMPEAYKAWKREHNPQK